MIPYVATTGVAVTGMFPKNVNLCARPTDSNDRRAHALN